MDETKASDNGDRNRRVVEMREKGASWKEIQAVFDLSRQQARHAYQLGKRAERRAARRGAD